MDAIKNIPTRDVLSIVTGKGFGNSISSIGRAMSHVLGYPIFTHEMPGQRELATNCLHAQFPALRSLVLPENATPETWMAWLDEQHRTFGAEMSVTKGNEVRMQHPVDSLKDAGVPEHKIIEAPDTRPVE